MAWRRRNGRGRTRRTRRTRTKRKPTTRKSLVRLIKQVSLSTAETKRYAVQFNPFSIGTIGSATEWSIAHHLFYDIPNLGNTATRTDNSFIGEEIWAKGVKFRFQMVPGSLGNFAMRISIISVVDAGTFLATPGQAVTPTPWYEQSTANILLTPARRRFNPSKVNVLKSRTYWLRPQGAGFVNPWKSLWIKFNRKFRRMAEEDNVNEVWGLNRGKDYYMIAEFWNPAATSLVSGLNGTIDKIVYFKDS